MGGFSFQKKTEFEDSYSGKGSNISELLTSSSKLGIFCVKDSLNLMCGLDIN